MNQSQLVEGQKWGGESPKQMKSIGRKTNALCRSYSKTKSTMRSSKNFSQNFMNIYNNSVVDIHPQRNSQSFMNRRHKSTQPGRGFPNIHSKIVK